MLIFLLSLWERLPIPFLFTAGFSLFSRGIPEDPSVYVHHVSAFLQLSQEERLLSARHFRREEYGGMMQRPPRRLPPLDGDVIAHSEQTPFSYCLLLSSEGRLKRPLFQFRSVFLWVACNVFFFSAAQHRGCAVSVGSSFKCGLSESVGDRAWRRLPRVLLGRKISSLPGNNTQRVYFIHLSATPQCSLPHPADRLSCLF